MAKVNFDSPEAKGLAAELAKYGNNPAPIPEYTNLKDRYNKVTGYTDVMNRAATANKIESFLTHASVLPMLTIAKVPAAVAKVPAAVAKVPAAVEEGTGLASSAVAKYFGKLDPKLATAEGAPKTFYHGTVADFDEFKQMPSASSKYKNTGYFFTSDPEFASTYASKEGGSVMPVNLKASNLFDATTLSPLQRRNVSESLVNSLKEQGYDGITGFRYPHEVVVFEPNQIKGIFNKAPTADNNIMKSAIPVGLASELYDQNKENKWQD